MSGEVSLVDGALVFEAQQWTGGLDAAEQALGVPAGAGRRALADLGFVIDDGQVPGAAVVCGFSGVLDGPADAALRALAGFIDGHSLLLWEDSNGVRWRYVVGGGEIVEQRPAVLWRDVDDQAVRTGGVVAPLTVSRCPQRYDEWWAGRGSRDEIVECLADMELTSEMEYALHRLMLEVFQSAEPSGASWLEVNGLGRGVSVSYLALDIDPAYGTDGVLDGVDLVLGMSVSGQPVRARYLTVSVYLDKVRWLLPEAAGDPAEALAGIVDAMLDLINAEIADRDQFTMSARDVLQA